MFLEKKFHRAQPYVKGAEGPRRLCGVCNKNVPTFYSFAATYGTWSLRIGKHYVKGVTCRGFKQFVEDVPV